MLSMADSPSCLTTDVIVGHHCKVGRLSDCHTSLVKSFFPAMYYDDILYSLQDGGKRQCHMSTMKTGLPQILASLWQSSRGSRNRGELLLGAVLCSAVQCSAVQCSAVQCHNCEASADVCSPLLLSLLRLQATTTFPQQATIQDNSYSHCRKRKYITYQTIPHIIVYFMVFFVTPSAWTIWNNVFHT